MIVGAHFIKLFLIELLLDLASSVSFITFQYHLQYDLPLKSFLVPRDVFPMDMFKSEYKIEWKLLMKSKSFYSPKRTCYLCLKETSWANARVKLHSQVHFESKTILGPKKCWVQKSFNFKINFGPVIT